MPREGHKDNSPEAVKNRLDKYNRKNPEDRVEFSDLPGWVRTAVTMVEVLGLSQNAAAKRCGKSAVTLSNYMNNSPAVLKWREELQKVSLDPIAMAEATIKANSLNVSLEYFAAYEKAIEASDYAAVAKMSQDLLDRQGITKKKEKTDSGKLNVTLNIAGGVGLDVPQISASYEEVEEVDSDFEVLGDADV